VQQRPLRVEIESPTVEGANPFEHGLATLLGEYDEKMERVGRVLHDEIGQVLSGVGMLLGVIGLDYQETPGLGARVTELQALLETAMSQTRALSRDLNPSLAERAGLHFALEQMVARYSDTFDGSIRLQFASPVHFPRTISTVFYRVAEYGVDHAIRGLKARRVEIVVNSVRGTSTLEIRHDGQLPPIAGGDAPGRLELLRLKSYAQRAGVPVTIETDKGKGTNISAKYTNANENV
jgi:signal transduction histidine kinase